MGSEPVAEGVLDDEEAGMALVADVHLPIDAVEAEAVVLGAEYIEERES